MSAGRLDATPHAGVPFAPPLPLPDLAPAPPEPRHAVRAGPVAQPPGPVTVGGDVKLAKLLKRVSPVYPPLARQARIQAVRQWEYRPTLRNRQPVEVIASIDVRFALSN